MTLAKLKSKRSWLRSPIFSAGISSLPSPAPASPLSTGRRISSRPCLPERRISGKLEMNWSLMPTLKRDSSLLNGGV